MFVVQVLRFFIVTSNAYVLQIASTATPREALKRLPSAPHGLLVCQTVGGQTKTINIGMNESLE